VMLGYPSREQALAAFAHGRSDDPNEVMGAAITVPVETFKEWLDAGRFKKPVVLKAHGPDTGPEEEIAKAEKVAHVKGHYRHINGKVVYVPDYDKTVHGDHPEATLHQRTVVGEKKGAGFLRATDSQDRKAIKTAAEALGIEITHVKRAGANHHGRVSAYDHIHFNTAEDAQKVHAALQGMPEPTGKHGPDTGPGFADDGADSPAEQAKVKLGVVVQDAVAAIEASPDLEGARKAREGAIGQLEAFLGQHKGEKEWAASMESAIRQTWRGKVTQMVNPARTSAMALIAGDDWMERAIYGAETESDVEQLVKMGDATTSISYAWESYNDKGTSAVSPMLIGHAVAILNTAVNTSGPIHGMIAKGKRRIGENEEVVPGKMVQELAKRAETMRGDVLAHYQQVEESFKAGKTASVQKHGFVRPFVYDLGIAAAKARADFQKGAGNTQGVEYQQNIAKDLTNQKAEAEKFAAYHDADPEALMGEGNLNSMKLAALSFRAKAKAKEALGEDEAAGMLMVKAKAAAGLALGME